MDLTLTDDQQLIQRTAREVLADADPHADPAARWKELVALGWTGLPFADEHGGAGSGFLELCLLAEELGRAQVAVPLATTVACCGMPIARFGAAEQRARWLAEIVRGRVLSPVLAPPGGRWGVAGSDVTAQGSGESFVLDGTALFVPYAAAADALVVVAQRGTPEELVVLLVDAGSAGVGVEELDVVGPHPAYRVTFDQVRAAEVLGDQPVAEAMTAFGTAASCAEMVGGAQGVLDMTVEYAAQREQFGKPIGSFQAVQHHCADMATDVLTARFIAYEAIWRLAEGEPAEHEVSLAKAWVSEAYQRVCAAGHQVHGAIGFTAEHALHRYLTHAMAAATAFGDGDFHTERIARDLGL